MERGGSPCSGAKAQQIVSSSFPVPRPRCALPEKLELAWLQVWSQRGYSQTLASSGRFSFCLGFGVPGSDVGFLHMLRSS